MAEGSYRDKLHAEIAAALLSAIEEKGEVLAVEIEDCIPFETPAESRKQVLNSLMKQGFITLEGSRRTAVYKATANRRIQIRVNEKTLAQLIRIGGPAYAQVVLHNADPKVFPPPSPQWRCLLPFEQKKVVDQAMQSLGLD